MPDTLQLTIFSLPSFAAAGLGAFGLWRVWPNRGIPGGTALMILIGAVIAWSLGQLAGTMVTTLPGKFLAAKLQYPALCLVPSCWCLFCLRFSGQLAPLARHWQWMIPLPLVTVLLAATNDAHGLIWQDARLVEVSGFVAWSLDYGTFFRVHTLWSYALVTLGSVSLLSALLRSTWHRRRAVPVAAAPILVILANAFYLLPDGPMRWLDVTPLGFALASLALLYAVTGQVLDLVPMGRDEVVRVMGDAVFAVEDGGRILDMNPAAEALAGVPLESAAGHLLSDVLPVPRAWISGSSIPGESRELILQRGEARTAWQVAVSGLRDADGRLQGRTLILHEVTRRWAAEKQLRELTEALTSANRELETFATTDPLTHLANRRTILRLVDEELARARRYQRRLALLVIDLDGFRFTNETYGLEAGDRVLRGVAELLNDARRDGDVVGRLGGEQFLVLLPETGPRDAGVVAERLRQLISARQHSTADGQEFEITASAGLAVFDPQRHPEADLIGAALRALDAAKAAGRNRVGHA